MYDGSNLKNYDTTSHSKQAQERIQEFNRLKRARQLLDAISLTNELLADGSNVEILSLANTIITRFKVLGVSNISLGKEYIHINIMIFCYIYIFFFNKYKFLQKIPVKIQGRLYSNLFILVFITVVLSVQVGVRKKPLVAVEELYLVIYKFSK